MTKKPFHLLALVLGGCILLLAGAAFQKYLSASAPSAAALPAGSPAPSHTPVAGEETAPPSPSLVTPRLTPSVDSSLATAQAARLQSVLAAGLASQAELLRLKSPALLPTSLLLAAESALRQPNAQADATLRAGLSLLPRLALALPPGSAGGASNVNVVAFSSDGRYLLTAGADGVARIWDALDGKAAGQVDHSSAVIQILARPGTQQVVSADNQEILVWDLPSGAVARRIAFPANPSVLVISPDGRFLASALNSRIAHIWDLDSPTGEPVILTLSSEIRALAFSPAGKYLATITFGESAGYHPPEAWLWDARSGAPVRQLYVRGNPFCLEFSPDGKLLAIGGDAGTQILMIGSGEEVRRLPDPAAALAFSPNGSRLALAGSGGVVLWPVRSGGERLTTAESDPSNWVRFSPDGRLLAEGSASGGASILNAENGALAYTLPAVQPASLSFDPSGAWAAAVRADSSAGLWQLDGRADLYADLQSGLEARPAVGAAAFSPSGKYLAATLTGGRLFIWQMDPLQPTFQITTTIDAVRLSFSPEGAWLVLQSEHAFQVYETGSWRAPLLVQPASPGGPKLVSLAFPARATLAAAYSDGSLRFWDLLSGQEQLPGVLPANGNSLRLSPDGRYLAAFAESGAGTVWELAGSRPLFHLAASPGAGLEAAFSPSGRMLAVASHSGEVRLFSIPEGHELARLQPAAPPLGLVFSQDEHFLITRDEQGASLWELPAGRELTRLPAGPAAQAAALSPDNRLLAVGSRLWLWQPGDLLPGICSRLSRNLTPSEWRQYLGEEPYHKTCPALP